MENKTQGEIKYLVLDLDQIFVLCSKKPFYFNQQFLLHESEDDSDGEEATGSDLMQSHPEHLRYLDQHHDRKMVLNKKRYLKFRPHLNDFIEFLTKNTDKYKVGVWTLAHSCQEEADNLANIVFGKYYKHLQFVYHGAMGNSKRVRDPEVVWKLNPTWDRNNTRIIENVAYQKGTLAKDQEKFALFVEPFRENEIYDDALLDLIDVIESKSGTVARNCGFLTKCQEIFKNQVLDKLKLEHEIVQNLDMHLRPYIVDIVKNYYGITIPIGDFIQIPLLNNSLTNSQWQIFFVKAKGCIDRVEEFFIDKLKRTVTRIDFIGSLNVVRVLEPEQFFVNIGSESKEF